MKKFLYFESLLKNPTFKGGFTENQYIGERLSKKKGLDSLLI